MAAASLASPLVLLIRQYEEVENVKDLLLRLQGCDGLHMLDSLCLDAQHPQKKLNTSAQVCDPSSREVKVGDPQGLVASPSS